MKKKTFIIAEAGINHNGKISQAKKLVDAAVKSGADAIKFQTFLATSLATQTAKKVDYQKRYDRNESMLQMLKKNELTFNQFSIIKKYCDKKKIEFISSAFDEESIIFLKKLRLRYFKIPSGEITNYPLLKIISKLNKKVLISTGMSNIKEIKKTFILLQKLGLKKKNIIIMQCNSTYPAPVNQLHLNVIRTFKKKFKTFVGFSDHSENILAPSIAVAMGAEFIEKHFTISKSLKGPDHFFSLNPNQFKSMVENIRYTENMMGKINKFVTKNELENRSISRKSIVAKNKIKKGEKFTIYNLTTKRPGNGISPMNWTKVIGQKAKRNYKIDDQIK
tara:strand:+ start:32 stop:1033 length:1002 start_codon:yes stop_codon:yes gene_type:complete